MKFVLLLIVCAVLAFTCKEQACKQCVEQKRCAFFGNKTHKFCSVRESKVKNLIYKAVKQNQCVFFGSNPMFMDKASEGVGSSWSSAHTHNVAEKAKTDLSLNKDGEVNAEPVALFSSQQKGKNQDWLLFVYNNGSGFSCEKRNLKKRLEHTMCTSLRIGQRSADQVNLTSFLHSNPAFNHSNVCKWLKDERRYCRQRDEKIQSMQLVSGQEDVSFHFYLLLMTFVFLLLK